MQYIDSIKGTAICLVLFILLGFFYVGKGSVNDVGVILTISTFLFAILAGFFISRLNSRYDRFLELASDEDAAFISLYYMSKDVSDEFSEKMTDLIDKYYIICYDFPLDKQYTPTIKYFREMHNLVHSSPREDPYDDMLACLGSIELYRNKCAVSGEDKMTPGQWVVLFILAAIIIFSIFYIADQRFFFQISTILFSTATISILLIMRDLQNLRLGKPLAFESGQENFENIGRLRYYPEEILKDKSIKVPKHVKEYRVGHHKPGEEFNISVEKNKYFKSGK